MVKDRKLITDNSLYERLSLCAESAVSYQKSEYQLGEILAKIALERIKQSDISDWGNLKPLYIQPPPVFGR